MEIKKYLLKNDMASIHPAAMVIIVLAIASFLVLLLGPIMEVNLNFINSPDDDISASVAEPRNLMSSFLQIIWPKGVLLVIFFVILMTMLMEYQKGKYKPQWGIG